MSTLKGSRGFTLIEVMAASIILATVLGGMAAIFVLAARQSSVTSNKVAALYHANETIRLLSIHVADEPFAAPEDDGAGANGWFEGWAQNPDWQSCTSAAGPWADCYALSGAAAPGLTTHYRNPFSLSSDFTAAPISGSVRYEVSSGDPFPGWKKVVVKASWTEP